MNNGRNSHAHRTPESVSSHTAAQRRTSNTAVNRSSERGGTYSNVQLNGSRDKNYTFSRGSAAYPHRMTSSKSITSLTPAEEKKIQKRKANKVKELQKERKWQNEIVRVRGRIDVVLLLVMLLLLVLGSVTVYSASYPLALSEGRAANYYIVKQLQFIGIGMVCMLFEIFFFPIDIYKNKYIVFIAYFTSIALLLVTLFKGNAEGEAIRWIRIGPVNVQPSEIMKFSMILMMAWYADKYDRRMKEIHLGFESYCYNTFIPFLILFGACIFVVLGKHLSGTAIIAVIGGMMMLVAGYKAGWSIATLVPCAVGGIGFYLIRHPYALRRLTSFFDPNADTTDEMYQTTQSIYAIGSGGFWGVGIGDSRQKYSYLTQAHTDFIFSIWCEEWGFVGALLLIGLFVVLIWRGYTIAVKAPDKFTMLTAFGITTHIGIQAFMNMFVASKLFMNTGVTLPFFSYGGSSMLVLLAEMGVLLSISRQYYKKKSDIERERMMNNLGM